MFIDLPAPVFISSYFSSSGNFIIIGFPYANLCASGDCPHSVFLTYLIVISFPPFTLSFVVSIRELLPLGPEIIVSIPIQTPVLLKFYGISHMTVDSLPRGLLYVSSPIG